MTQKCFGISFGDYVIKKNIYDMVAWGYEIPFLVFKGERVEYFSTFENKILYLCMALQYRLLFLKILLIIL